MQDNNSTAGDSERTDAPPTLPGKRRHTFYVTTEGAAPATTPRFAPLVEPPRHEAAAQARRDRLANLGAIIFVGGIALAIGTCVATNAADGGGFRIATGPIIAGLVLMLRASR